MSERKLTKETGEEMIRLFNEGMVVKEISERLGISTSTINKVCEVTRLGLTGVAERRGPGAITGRKSLRLALYFLKINNPDWGVGELYIRLREHYKCEPSTLQGYLNNKGLDAEYGPLWAKKSGDSDWEHSSIKEFHQFMLDTFAHPDPPEEDYKLANVIQSVQDQR